MWRVFVLSLFVIVCALDQNNQSEWKSADLFAQQTEPFDAKLPQGIVSIVKYFGSVQFFNNSRLGSKFFDAIHDYYGITTRGRISTVELPGNPCIHDNFVIAVASQPDTYITVLLSDQIRHSCKVDNSTRTVLQFISDEDIVNASFHIGATAEVDNTFSSNMTRADVFMMLNTVTAAILYHKSQTFLPGPAKKIKSSSRMFRRAKSLEFEKKDGVIKAPVWTLVLCCCVAVVALVGVIAFTVVEYRNTERKCEEVKREFETQSRKGDAGRSDELEALLGKENNSRLLKQSSLDSALSDKIYRSSAEAPISNSQFVRYMANAARLRCGKIGRVESRKVVTGDVHNKYSRWNDKPAKEGDILADIIDLLIPLAANNKRPFLLDFSPGEQAYVDVVINALCTGLEALGALRQEYSDLPYLEMKVVDWLGSAMALPASFTHNGGTGGGYVLRSTKEAFTTAMAAAQQLKLQRIKSGTSVSKSEKHIIKRMVVYASSQAQFVFEEVFHLCGVHCRIINVNNNMQMDVEALEKQVRLDFDSGFYPVFVQALMGASSTGSYDDISSLLRVAYRYGLWLHVDASLGGNLLICNENCDMLRDIEKVHSISVDTHAFLMNAPQATFIWTRNLAVLERGRLVAEQSLNHNPGASDLYEPRPRTPLPALKAYMAMRLNGMNSSQKRIRHVYAMTKRLREFMSKDARLEIINNDRLNVICFRVKGTDIADSNVLTYRLCAFFNKSGRILVTHWMAHGMGMIRMCINHGNANEKVIDEAWNVMKTLVDQFTGYLLRSYKCFST